MNLDAAQLAFATMSKWVILKGKIILKKLKDNYPKIVVSGERSFENSYDGVEHVYIRDFLSSELNRMFG